ncbi:hypothetical protein GOBAR_AA11788 [Gossypium barbadense]|uniref:Uncharacterized protein n=1 Tax=Gossypium barbadense TaxID=3634 RepID=A0A2P5XZT4_GOSBA|nr:hypothetical protein GOBAR_AA11788 [Gossypium barbadense]
MEVIKRSCFDKIVEETKLDFSEFDKSLKILEERVCKCYEEAFCLDSYQFVEKMVYALLLTYFGTCIPKMFANWDHSFTSRNRAAPKFQSETSRKTKIQTFMKIHT